MLDMGERQFPTLLPAALVGRCKDVRQNTCGDLLKVAPAGIHDQTLTSHPDNPI